MNLNKGSDNLFYYFKHFLAEIFGVEKEENENQSFLRKIFLCLSIVLSKSMKFQFIKKLAEYASPSFYFSLYFLSHQCHSYKFSVHISNPHFIQINSKKS